MHQVADTGGTVPGDRQHPQGHASSSFTISSSFCSYAKSSTAALLQEYVAALLTPFPFSCSGMCCDRVVSRSKEELACLEDDMPHFILNSKTVLC
jgi:hypothetical protein